MNVREILHMKIIATGLAAVSLIAVAGCNQSPTEQKADAVEQNAEDTADMLEDASDNGVNEASEEAIENKADVVRAEGKNEADAIREGNTQ